MYALKIGETGETSLIVRCLQGIGIRENNPDRSLIVALKIAIVPEPVMRSANTKGSAVCIFFVRKQRAIVSKKALVTTYPSSRCRCSRQRQDIVGNIIRVICESGSIKNSSAYNTPSDLSKSNYSIDTSYKNHRKISRILHAPLKRPRITRFDY